MLIKAKTLKGYKMESLDGEIGEVKEFYFDDRHWTIRYLVADTGNWLTGKQVLISPYALGDIIKDKKGIVVNLTRTQIENSPRLESDRPVSRQFEESYFGYYGWPIYWSGSHMWGIYPGIVRDSRQWKEPPKGAEAWDHHLRSTDDVDGRHIQATDGEIGHVEDFLIDADTWAIRYLIVDTKNWWSGKKVLISPKWIERVSWQEEKVFVKRSRAAIKRFAEYKGVQPLIPDYEVELHRPYVRQDF